MESPGIPGRFNERKGKTSENKLAQIRSDLWPNLGVFEQEIDRMANFCLKAPPPNQGLEVRSELLPL